MTFLSSWGSEIEAGESGGGHDWPGLLSFHADLHATWPSDLDGDVVGFVDFFSKIWICRVDDLFVWFSQWEIQYLGNL